jgi:hypothetical protein
LELTNVLRTELIGRAVKVCGEPPDGTDVDDRGSLRVIAALELIEHLLAKTGHRDLLVTRNLTPKHFGEVIRVASAARAA